MTVLRRLHALGLTLGLLLGLAGSGCDGQQGPAQKAPPPPAAVEVARAEQGELTESWFFIGEIRSLEQAQLAMGAGGEVVMIEAREGDRVEAGTLLVEIDKRQARARLSAAVSSRRESERELEQARRQAQRAQDLGATVIAREQIEQEEVRAETLEARRLRLGAEIQAAKAQLSDYRLVAPFTGVIAARHVDVGQWVDPGEPVLEIISVDAVEILVDVRPELLPHLQVGGTASLRPAGGLPVSDPAQATATAEIRGIVPSLDPTTRTIKVRLQCGEPRSWLVPGAPVDVGFPVHYETASVSDSTGASAVLVPRDALVLGAVDVRVLVVEDGVARPVQVEIRASAGERALIVGPGLKPGDQVVTRGNERLRPGQEVKILETPAPAKEPAS
ncbi:MAG: efflux RND transporter periplasmic adaptor subunit [Myxococcales bacterium]|nr:efflux RND transporter periplasmic adaptor subunit [Myxococcales bacterium]